MKLAADLIAFLFPRLLQDLEINNRKRTCLGRLGLQTFLQFYLGLWNVILDLSEAQGKPVTVITRLNIKHLKIRAEEGSKIMYASNSVIELDYFWE